jgi:hypothetical protein
MEIIRTAVSYSALLTALLIGSGNVHTAEAYSPMLAPTRLAKLA